MQIIDAKSGDAVATIDKEDLTIDGDISIPKVLPLRKVQTVKGDIQEYQIMVSADEDRPQYLDALDTWLGHRGMVLVP